MIDRSHLNALETRLSHERAYLAAAKTEGERKLRRVWIAQLEREIAAEKEFLGIAAEPADEEMSLDELHAALAEPSDA